LAAIAPALCAPGRNPVAFWHCSHPFITTHIASLRGQRSLDRRR
jgi:hypothetical protein